MYDGVPGHLCVVNVHVRVQTRLSVVCGADEGQWDRSSAMCVCVCGSTGMRQDKNVLMMNAKVFLFALQARCDLVHGDNTMV